MSLGIEVKLVAEDSQQPRAYGVELSGFNLIEKLLYKLCETRTGFFLLRCKAQIYNTTTRTGLQTK